MEKILQLQRLSKEQIEAIISDRYLESNDFKWDGDFVEFNTVGTKDLSYQFDVAGLMRVIEELKNQVHEMYLRLDEARLIHRLTVAEITHG